MSQIEKLRIQGIRSFDNQNGETIEFHAPLTLIVGYNGSGKTTIIECLKYATTGQQPPNSKGGAFIHDPKLCGEKEVLAQVKLQFRNASHNKLILTRNIQLTVKKTAMTQKTLECQLVMYNHGERTSMSSRVLDFDEFVPKQLGVSPAILENVIFCHQDDSLWPMSEPSKLKQKFDEIFEAQKYTKAIDAIGKMRKGHREKLALLVVHEGNYKLLKDKADRVEKKSLALQHEIDEHREKADSLDRDMKAAALVAKEKHQQANKALGIVEELKTKNQRAGYLEDTLEGLRVNLDELQESDEWLQSTLEQYEERMGQYEAKNDEYQIQYQELKEKTNDSRRQLSNKQAERGQYQAEKENYERHLESRVQLVKKAARTHSMRGYDGDLDDYQIREFVERVQKLSQEKDRELDRLRKYTNDELQQHQAVLSVLEGRRATRTQEKITAKQTISSTDAKLSQKQKELDLINMDEGVQASLEASISDIQDRLRIATDAYDAAEWDKSIKVEKSHLQGLELELRRLRDELFQSNQLAKDLAALDFTKNEVKQKQNSLNTLISTYSEKLNAIIGPNWQPSNIEREFQAVLDQRSQALTDAKKQQEGAARELSQLEFKLKSSRSNVTKANEEMQRCHAAVLGSIETSVGQPLASIDSYLEELKSLDKERNDIKKEIDGMDYVSDYYRKCLETANQHNCCRLCERAFLDKKEFSSAVSKIKKQLEKYVKGGLEGELADLELAFKKADAARSQFDTYTRLHDIDIPALKEDVVKKENERISMVSNLEQLDSTVNQVESTKRDVDTLASTVANIAKYFKEITKHEQDISRLSSQHKLSSSSLSAEEIKEQSEACEDGIRALNSKIDKMSTEKDRARTEINRLEIEKGNISNNLSSARYELEKKQGLVNAISELRDFVNQQRNAIQRVDIDLESLLPEFEKAKTQREDAQRRGQAQAKEVQAEKDKLAQTVNKFKLIEDSINAYLEDGGEAKLAACHRAIKILELDQRRIEGEMTQITENANELKKHMEDSERTKRSILDNIRFRKALTDLEVVKREVEELESRKVTDDYDRLNREATTADKLYQRHLAERGPVIGALRSKDQELEGLMKEWDTEYKDAADKYREMHIKVETTKAAIDDMGKYSTALDNAIMKYHSMKMEEINAIAGELWRSTYQGTDVDTIMIRSENENASSKRSYNYRVVMVKQDAEMDMRGRCSAGQKVLASIIIRLALAECFGVNCGVIALDEPTTNLDRDNIKALAESLNKIIMSRRHQSNFQLVIITHDEDFLQDMKCTEFSEIYWRVSRNAEQKSIIQKCSLSDFM